MSRIRTLFLGTPDIARGCLQALFEDPRFEIVGVISQPDRPAGRKLQLQPSAVKAFALSHRVPVFTPERVSEPEVLELLSDLKAELAVVVAFGQILKQTFLDLFPARVVNLHASLLPRWRGAAPIQRALMEGDLETGVCLQVMVKKLDAGPLIGERRIALPAAMNAIDLYRACEISGKQILLDELVEYCKGNITPRPQDEALVTLAPKIDKAEARLDWSRTATRLHHQVRGLAMGPTALTTMPSGGKILKIHRSRVLNAEGSGEAGQIIIVGETSMVVQCGQGHLELLELQPESRAKMSAADFIRGHALKVGDRFDE